MHSSNTAREAILEAIRGARRLDGPPIRDDAIITYTWDAKPAAHILYLALLHAGLRATLAHAALASVHIVPYRETGTVVAYTSSDRDVRVVNIAMAASALGLEVYVVGPEMHPAVEETLDQTGAKRITVPGENPLLTMMVASLLWRPRLLGAREERVRGEVEALPEALEWVESRYSREIEQASQGGYDGILYTPSIEAAALYHSMLTGIPASPLDEVVRTRPSSRYLAYIAGVDEHNYRDLLLKASLSQVKIARVMVDTDPVTLNIYGAMIASLALGRVL